jgi:hypothetical protein
VYRFGCAFIHLSSYHDYRERDPVLALDAQERADLLHHLRYYHGGPQTEHYTFLDITPYLPAVFAKVASNLESCLKDLEQDRQLDPHALPDPASAPSAVPSAR